MIPRHCPPFSSGSLLRTMFRSFKRVSRFELEKRYARQLNVPHAVWLPSARYGITRVLQYQTKSDSPIACPVFNCGAVHHAAAECERTIEFIDTAPGSFLVDCSRQTSTGHGVILSELFGHQFNERDLRQPFVKQAASRVFDLAMCIPTAGDFERMSPGDVSVLSFGLGKSLYAGWGGMAFTSCLETATMLKRRRDQDLQSCSRMNRAKWNSSFLVRTLAHERPFYGPIRSRRKHSGTSDTNSTTSFSLDTYEWHRPATNLHLQQCLSNLDESGAWAEKRTTLAEVYRSQLTQLRPVIQMPDKDSQGHSHFVVRVPAELRDKVCDQLWHRGIDAGKLFPFPTNHCDPLKFPRASQAASEVINLPLSNRLTERHVTHICRSLIEIIERLPTSTTFCTQREAA